jgi:hypothetical protein
MSRHTGVPKRTLNNSTTQVAWCEAEPSVAEGLASTGTFGRGLLGDTEQTTAPAFCTRDFDCESQRCAGAPCGGGIHVLC